MRIWITRAQPEAQATADRVRALRHEPVVAPVLEVQPAGEAPDLAGIGALAFTSRNGARALAALCLERNLPVFTVGDATAAAAREAGFTEVVSASGDVASLVAVIAERRAALNGQVLYAAPEEPAGDLVAALAARGVPARAHTVYRTAPAEFAPPADVDVVLLHSAKAARRLADHPDLAAAAPTMTAICISPAAAEPLSGLGFREVLTASSPNESAMIEALRTWAAGQAAPRLYTPVFWIVIGFGLVCIIAAMLVAGLGPRLFPASARHPAAPAAQPLQIR
jgi:uroporphyrinogen-III synthase